MAFSQETFPSDLILPGLVDWFNNQPLATRTIATTDVALFKVKVIVDETGTAQMIIGDAPYTNAGATFLCEATFVWKGTRGADLQATTASFFEVSKFVPQKQVTGGAINIIPFVGTVMVEEDVSVQILDRVMAYGFTNPWAGETTVGLTGVGHPEQRSTTTYMTQVTFPENGFKKVSAGEGWFAALHEDGSVYGWGHNYTLLGGYASTPTKIDISSYSSSTVVKDIAAIGKALQVINGDNLCFPIGETGFTTPLYTWPNAKQIDSLHVWDEYGMQVKKMFLYGISNAGEANWWSVNVEGGTIETISNAPPLNPNVRQIAFNEKFGAAVYNDDTLVLWGDANAVSGLPYMDAYYAEAVASVHMMNQGGIVILYKNGQLRYWLPTTQQWFTMFGATAVSAGYKHFVALFNEGNVDCRGDSTYGQTAYPDFSQPVRQVFAGIRHSVAMMQDGSLVWWGEGENNGSVGGGYSYAVG